MPDVKVHTVQNDSQLWQIYNLQKANLPGNISPEEMEREGFVTVDHTFGLLKRMNAPYPHVIATCDGVVVGYALVMLPEFRDEIEILIPMFAEIDRQIEKNMQPLHYFVMGQVCVAREFRGRGVFYELYDHMKNIYAPHFDACITEVDPANPRSLRAHYKAGYEPFVRYTDPGGRPWELIIWRWNT